ncbi:MAG: signal peptidase II [Rickettsiales bacterium]|nr:signal peptidase II [Rickettsiales bacterium]
MKTKKLFLLGISIALLVAFFDLLSKKFIFDILENIAFTDQTNNPEIKVFDFFSLVYVWNRGVSFGMFNQLENSHLILSLVQGSIAAVLIGWLYLNEKPHFSYALGFIIGGALGNVVDRIKNGAVADFLDFHIASYHWPAFNLADSFVFIGVMILIFDDLFFSKK